jgi:hypothetical protein
MVQVLAPELIPVLPPTLEAGQKALIETGLFPLSIRLISYLVMGDPLEIGVFQVNLKEVQVATTEI